MWFITNNYSSAVAVGNAYGVPADWLLGWSVAEVGWGSSSVVGNGNFYNETLPKGSQTGGWTNAILCGGGTKAGYACFASYADSATAALDSKYGQIITSGIAQKTSISSIFQKVADAGFDPKGSSDNADYGKRVKADIASVDGRIDCLKQYGYLR